MLAPRSLCPVLNSHAHTLRIWWNAAKHERGRWNDRLRDGAVEKPIEGVCAGAHGSTGVKKAACAVSIANRGRMYVCMYASLHLCMYASMYVRMCLCMCWNLMTDPDQIHRKEGQN